MRSFFCPDIPAPGSEATLQGEEAFHAVRVLRLREGDTVRLLDGRGVRAVAEIARLERRGREDTVSVRISQVGRWEPPRVKLHLLVAPPRAKLMAQLVKDATELGVWRITPLLCEFSVAKPEGGGVVEHWRADALAALKQSGNPFLPELDAPRPFAQALRELPAAGVFGDVAAAGGTGSDRPAAASDTGVLPVWIGPEGGFSEGERGALLGRGAVPVQVGSWILRVETAVPAMLGLLLGAGGDDYCCHQRA
jgi:16S rRNA (uracil1498-N3)-methyltransferase